MTLQVEKGYERMLPTFSERLGLRKNGAFAEASCLAGNQAPTLYVFYCLN